jgi:hypothetical protein
MLGLIYPFNSVQLLDHCPTAYQVLHTTASPLLQARPMLLPQMLMRYMTTCVRGCCCASSVLARLTCCVEQLVHAAAADADALYDNLCPQLLLRLECVAASDTSSASTDACLPV